MSEKAHVIMHMMTTIDGKISIDWDGNEDYEFAGDVYDRLQFQYGIASGCGRATFQEGEPEPLNGYEGKTVSRKDHVRTLEKGETLFFVFDRRGKCRWEENFFDYGGHKSKVVEVITNQVSNAFLAYLDEKNIQYIFAGETDMDPEVFLEKLVRIWGLHTFVLCGGAEINEAFMEKDLVDEISLVIGPAVDGTRMALTAVGGNNPKGFPKYFHLKSVETPGHDTVVLHYEK